MHVSTGFLLPGGAAQIKAIKKIAAPIRVELAQYRELAAFSQFGSELDADTKEKLAQGERIKEDKASILDTVLYICSKYGLACSAFARAF